MKNLLLLSVLGLAACTEARGVHGDWAQGAHFSPNTATEFRARAQRGEPGVFPAPTGYSVYTERQRIASGAAASDGVIRQGTASSRTGLYSETEAVVQVSATETVKIRKVGNTTVKTYTYGTPPRKATVETEYVTRAASN
ncbi:hypothetical protein BCF46_1295 [Litoreibacter meonggei]|uniref:Lipoprotein n=1 Tax=Litoreibacter meonggei TaxID=1049199 RepID=A0A497WQS2_9RHOB|nr:hypothetical protein [Litoreibacter meonggei]RLJ59151.1 hypothetical protein BCF46_1295 [Litoreibacter meonggei]